MNRKIGILTAAMVFVLCAAGCGSGGSSTPPPPATYTIGGIVNGLAASGLVLADGGQTVSPVSGATSFTFPTAVASGAGYSVMVQAQHTGETCSIASGGSGSVGSSNVTTVVVSCAANQTYTICGMINGLTASGLVLADGSQTVSPASGAATFTFPTAVASGTSYSVTVQTQPNGETCSIASGGSGSVGSSNVTSVVVSCATNTFTIGGMISGLTASGLLLSDVSGGGYQGVSVGSGATTFAFPSAITSGTSYSVAVQTQPSGLVCQVAEGSGTVGSSNITNVVVTCVASPEAVLYSFQGGTDGAFPEAGLIMDGSGSVYGTTTTGGTGSCNVSSPYGNSTGCGTVFKLTKGGNGSYTETVLYSFQGGTADGIYPDAGLIMDGSGNLYGTTEYGGAGSCNSSSLSGCGTIFELTKGSNETYTENLLYSFQGGTDGAYPVAGLIMDGSGNLYGTTESGGLDSCQTLESGITTTVTCGTVFKLTAGNGGSYTESVLYGFQGPGDGAYPLAGLIIDSGGNLYATTYRGGTGACKDEYFGAYISNSIDIGCGTVFKLTGNGTESVLYSFQVGTGGVGDGFYPDAGVIMDSGGDLYGTTGFGGAGAGTVFKLVPEGNGSYTESVLHNFQGGATDGSFPQDSLVIDGSGNLYGTTTEGILTGEFQNTAGPGMVFKLAPGGNGSYAESVLYNFQGGTGDGALPLAGLIMDGSGTLYGTTTQGGTGSCLNGCGTIFEITQ